VHWPAASVEDDARWAYRFQRKFSEKLKDRDDIYHLEVKSSEERRKSKGLPPRVVSVLGGHAHRFRDTFAVELLLAGVPIDRVYVLLGHSRFLWSAF
jgi:integrase